MFDPERTKPLSRLQSRVFTAAIVLACFIVVGLAAAATFGQPAQPCPRQKKPREVCHDGVVYLEFPRGAVFAKLNPAGHIAVCS